MLLEGGSYRGIYTSGVLDVLMEHDLYPDCVVGVSAGSLNGMGYVAKQPGRCRDIVLTYGLDPRYVGGKALRWEHNLIGFDFILRDLQKVLPLDTESFYDPSRKFYAVVTNCRTGQPEFLDRDNCPDFLAALAASSSMPYLCRKVQLDGQEYLDGGVSSRLGLEFLEQHPEYDRVVVVLTRRLQYRKKAPSKLMRNLAHRLYSDYPQLLEVLLQEDELYARDREALARLQQEGRVLVIQPQTELDIARLERDKDKLKLGYETGQRDGERYLEQVRAWFQDDSPAQVSSEIS
jgi:predicted patatin/cPLA2 family phospholipase